MAAVGFNIGGLTFNMYNTLLIIPKFFLIKGPFVSSLNMVAAEEYNKALKKTFNKRPEQKQKV